MQTLLAWVKNKYFLVSAFFVLWMLFFDVNDFASQYKTIKELKELQTQRDFYQKQTQQVYTDMDELNSNPAKLEKFAREKYFMKKDNEDIYVVVPNK